MRLISYDGVTLNDGSGPNCGIDNSARRGFQTSLTFEPRRNRAPRLRGVEPQERSLAFMVWPPDGATASDPYLAGYEATVHWLFRRDDVPRLLVAERVPGDATTRMEAWAIVDAFDPDPDNRVRLTGRFIIPEGTWRALATTTDAASPSTPGGSAVTYPLLAITGSATGDRYRITITDRTGHGGLGWLAAVAWAHPAAESWLWVNGVLMPFLVTGGRLWFRADITAGAPTLVDLYHIAGSDNAEYADQLITAGTTLDAALASGTSVVAELSTAGANAVSAGLTWQPATTAAHHDGLPYAFGLSGENQITLIDREATGERQLLADDADSLIFTSPVEIAQSSAFDVTVRSGIRQPEATESGTSEVNDWGQSPSVMRDRPAYLMVRLSAGGSGLLGEEFYEGEGVDAWTAGTPEGTIPPPYFVAELTWGQSSASILRYEGGPQFDSAGGGHSDYTRDAYFDADSFAEGLANAVDGLGAVQMLSDYLARITFSGAGKGVALPFMGLSLSNIEVPMILDQAWVDANGRVITDDERAGAEPANGRVRVVLRYRVRDDESWYTAWSQVVNGDTAASLQTITVPAQSYPAGAVQLAIGLESVANGKNAIDWGVLTVSESPTLTFAAGVTPLVDVSAAVDAMRIAGAVAFDTNGDGTPDTRLTLDGVFCDAGLSIDCDDPWVEGVGGVGPVYGVVAFSDPTAWVALSPTENSWETSGDVAGVSLTYAARWSV